MTKIQEIKFVAQKYIIYPIKEYCKKISEIAQNIFTDITSFFTPQPSVSLRCNTSGGWDLYIRT